MDERRARARASRRERRAHAGRAGADHHHVKFPTIATGGGPRCCAAVSETHARRFQRLPVVRRHIRGVSREEDRVASRECAGKVVERNRHFTLREIADMIAFFRVLPEYGVDLFPNKKNKVTPELAAEILPAARMR